MVQLSHPYKTTRKTIALPRQIFVSKVMSLLFNMLCRLVIAFLLRNKGLLISWLQSSSAVILEPKKIKSVTVSIVSPSICHEVMGLDAMVLLSWMLSFKPAFKPGMVWAPLSGWKKSKEDYSMTGEIYMKFTCQDPWNWWEHRWEFICVLSTAVLCYHSRIE